MKLYLVISMLFCRSVFADTQISEYLKCYQELAYLGFGSNTSEIINGQIVLTSQDPKGFYIYTTSDVKFFKLKEDKADISLMDRAY